MCRSQIFENEFLEVTAIQIKFSSLLRAPCNIYAGLFSYARVASWRASTRHLLCDTHDFKLFAYDFELDFKFGEAESVNAFGIVLVGGSRILLQDFNKCGAFVCT